MKLFAGTLSLEQEIHALPEMDFDMILIDAKNIFVMWGIEEEDMTELQLQEMFEKKLGKIQEADITLEGLKRVEILMEEYEEGSYEAATFEGPYVDIDDLVARFADSGEVLTIREIASSQKYGNMIVRVDFLY